MTVEEHNVLILRKKLLEALFILVALYICERVGCAEGIYDVALAHICRDSVAAEEGVEEQIYVSVFVCRKLLFEPIELPVGYKLHAEHISVAHLAEENEDVAVALIDKVESVRRNIEYACGL